MECVKSPDKNFSSVGDNYISEKGIYEKKEPLGFEDLGEEHQGIIDMTFHFEDYIGNDNESTNGTVTVETEKGDESPDPQVYEECKDSAVKESIVGPVSTGPEQIEETEEDCVNESLEIIKEMSVIFNTKLSSESLQMCLRLIEDGADYVALAEIIKKWRIKKAPKPVRKLGHFFDTLEDPTKEKKEWVW
ncbi:unnamed protein product [Allacma fusca]|uniref:Uncharacterized protein n=1 Tax=Allacma fusca TaxID=39272 RepID=A0A8J2PFX2_9HEXA|nr:unnamed protein product [Allacma fusca]